MSTSWLNTSIAIRTAEGWRYCDAFAALGPVQRRILAALARSALDGSVPRGTPSRIAQAFGVHRESIWTQLRVMRRKFGVRSNTELAQIGKQLSRTRERGRSSNRASMIATAEPVNAGDRNPQSEALHPGTAPSRAL